MTVEEAREVVTREWLPISEQNLKCPTKIDDSLTEEHDWGWSFYCVPIDPNQCPQSKRSVNGRGVWSAW